MNLPMLFLMPAMSLMKEYCYEPKDEGTCQKYTSRYYYNSQAGHCEEFIYRGCEGNRNNFRTMKSCQDLCTKKALIQVPECKLPLVLGSCLLSLPRYYFNITSGKCEEFTYRGCNGNLNNFYTFDECESKCLIAAPQDLKKDMCYSKPDPGPCMAEIERFHYSPQTGNCYPFTYGGCGGNANNYISMDSCISTCNRKTDTYI